MIVRPACLAGSDFRGWEGSCNVGMSGTSLSTNAPPAMLQPCKKGWLVDISMAAALIQAAGPIRRLLADKGYDADHLRKLLAEQGAEAVIPSTTSRRAPIPYDTLAYRDRNRVERMWCRLKDFRRVATRYDKLARNYLAGALIAATYAYWLN